MAFEAPRVAVPSAARTASGNSGGISLAASPGRDVSLLVDVTAVAGVGPTLDLAIEWSMDGVSFAAAETADSFTQITAAKKTVKRFTVKAPHYRIVWTLAGTTPSFTFAVSEYVVS